MLTCHWIKASTSLEHRQHLCCIWGLGRENDSPDHDKPLLLTVQPEWTITNLRNEVSWITGISTAEYDFIERGDDIAKGDTDKIFDDKPGTVSQIPGIAIAYLSLRQRETQPTSMQVLVKTLSGKTITLFCARTGTAGDLKYWIARKENMPENSLRLIFEGKQLESDVELSKYNIRRVYLGPKLSKSTSS